MSTVLLILSSCADVPTVTHEPDPARSELELPDLGAEAPPDLELPRLLPGWQELPIEALLKAEVVSFPPAGPVGVCHTQVASRTRPLPFRVHRIEVELPKAAWEEAEGGTALLQYRRFSGSKRYVMRVARCRIPDSELAVNLLFDRFSSSSVNYSDDRFGIGPKTSNGEATPWVLGRLSERPPQVFHGVRRVAQSEIATAEDCPEGGDGSEERPIEIDEFETGDDCHIGQEYDPELDECYCENGSDEPDCWLEPEDPDDGDGTCDPSFENCDDGGGGSDGGGGATNSGDDEALSAEPPDCNEEDLPPIHDAWCNEGESPSPTQLNQFDSWVNEFAQHCPELETRWPTVRPNVRVWTYSEDSGFRGGAPVPGDWMLAGENHPDLRGQFLHELLHTDGWSHEDPGLNPDPTVDPMVAFENKWEECNGAST